jgi:hypothetical protein
MRCQIVSLLALAMATSAAAQTTAPGASKPLLSSNDLTIGDYCTIILAPKVQDTLHTSDAQRTTLVRERDRFELMLSSLTQHTAGRGTTPLLGVARRGLEVEGQRIRDVLTADQDVAFQKLFADKSLKPIDIKVASSVPHPGPRPTKVFGEIELFYTHYQESDPAAAKASPAAAGPAPAPVASAPPIPAAAVAPAPAAALDAHSQHLDPAFAQTIQFVLAHQYYHFATLRNGAFAKQPYLDVASPAGVLVGLRCTLNPRDNTVVAVQPIFLTTAGETAGTVHGAAGGKPVELHAKPGYAVGAVKTTGGGGLNSITLSYMRIHGQLLDPNDTYDSDKIGGPGGSGPQTLGGDGTPIIGICGKVQQPAGPYMALSIVSMPNVATLSELK